MEEQGEELLVPFPSPEPPCVGITRLWQGVLGREREGGFPSLPWEHFDLHLFSGLSGKSAQICLLLFRLLWFWKPKEVEIHHLVPILCYGTTTVFLCKIIWDC